MSILNKDDLMNHAQMPRGAGMAQQATSADQLLGMLLGIRGQYAAGDPVHRSKQEKDIIAQIDERVLTIISGIQLQPAPRTQNNG